eukprot:1160328-Pelagomonas_calceolata.AAC.1
MLKASSRWVSVPPNSTCSSTCTCIVCAACAVHEESVPPSSKCSSTCRATAWPDRAKEYNHSRLLALANIPRQCIL